MFYTSRIFDRDKKAQIQLNELLKKENIQKDRNLDYTLGIYHEDRLVATGSGFKNTLRCIAIDSDYQGEGLMNTLISALLDMQQQLGYFHCFVYTKKNTARFFQDLGFYPITETEHLVFLENKKNGFENFLKNLEEETAEYLTSKKHQFDTTKCNNSLSIGAIVMNANPFTLGHLYLVENAANKMDLLHLFIVSDEASIVPNNVRKELVIKGTSHLENIIYHDTGDYMISMATFPAYFLKDIDEAIIAQAELDVHIFEKIASNLSINHRFIGEEPFSRVTNAYNQVMIKELSKSGINVDVIMRKEIENGVISASKVRELIQQDDWEQIKKMVPKTTFEFFQSSQGESIVETIKKATDVIHY